MDATRTSEGWAALADSTVGFLSGLESTRQAVTSADVARKTGKKRVRRIQLELPFFRNQVRDLELKLKRIKLQNANTSPTVHCKVEVGVEPTDRRSSPDSLWNGIAERQLKERLRAEQQQRELQSSNVELANLSVELQKILQKCHNNQEMVEQVTRKKQLQYLDYTASAADEIFVDQLATVARLRLELLSAPCRTLYPSAELSMGREVVKWDPKVDAGFIMENRSGLMLPFELNVAVQAYWRFFGCGYGEKCHVRKPSDLMTDILARSFQLRTEFEGFTAKTRGKFTCRRYLEEDGVTIVWVGGGDVLKFGSTKFHGIQVRKRGAIKLRRVIHQGPGHQSTSTVVETTFQTIPVFREGLADREQQTQTLIDEIDRSYNKVNKSFCQKMGRVLLEEDWKATFGREVLEE